MLSNDFLNSLVAEFDDANTVDTTVARIESSGLFRGAK